MLTPRHAAPNTLSGHLTLTLKWEGVQLGVPAVLFQIIEDDEIEQIVSATPTGAYARRLLFLYEWLTGRTLALPDMGKVKAVPVIDPKLQFALAKGQTVTRQKVVNSLPGTPAFCPLVRRTPKLHCYLASKLPERANERPENLLQISPKADDLEALVEGMVAFDDRSSAGGSDPVITAAELAFGFASIYPFVNGNVRLHRWLIHHSLARGGFNPPGVVFPISAAILHLLNLFRQVLESYSRPLLKVIDWAARMGGNVEVKNDTADFYRFFDATTHAEFLFDRVAETVEEDLPREVQYLRTHDAFLSRIEVFFNIPKSTLDLLWRGPAAE